jgi:hypothetical protein
VAALHLSIDRSDSADQWHDQARQLPPRGLDLRTGEELDLLGSALVWVDRPSAVFGARENLGLVCGRRAVLTLAGFYLRRRVGSFK